MTLPLAGSFPTPQSNAPSDYIDNADFNAWFDDLYPGIDVQGETYSFSKPASAILFELDTTNYEAALREFRESQLAELKTTIMDEFPRPMAYYFFCTERNYETEKQRLERLKDTWEAIIYCIFALVVSECRVARLPLKGVKRPDGRILSIDDFRSDKLYDKLQVIEAILNHATNTNRYLVTSALIDTKALAKIRKLNQERNEFSHIAALSEQQAEQEYLDIIGTLIDVLRDVLNLQNVKFLRYRNSAAGNALSLRCEVFSGHKLAREMKAINVTSQTFAANGAMFHDGHIIAEYKGLILPLEPFVHFQVDATGHSTDLSFFKRHRGSDSEFEVVARSLTVTLPKSNFQYVFDDLSKLLNT